MVTLLRTGQQFREGYWFDAPLGMYRVAFAALLLAPRKSCHYSSTRLQSELNETSSLINYRPGEAGINKSNVEFATTVPGAWR